MHGDYPSDFLVGSFIEKERRPPLSSSTTASNSFWGLVMSCFAAADLIMMFREKMKVRVISCVLFVSRIVEFWSIYCLLCRNFLCPPSSQVYV
ncbi:hypothetical protein CEXT_316731 [Caerostris extrusa]|uniref:Uncharacterized protein n=1 Tax=Caerostris extrusa TaxID=172846 RepID=A0AAV4TM83_CAEEX|nr:hypothetical protein CEXT_316731 [Caerostris extrusa]